MKLYRHKDNKKLYTINHLVVDIHHLNFNSFAGIYAEPYDWRGEQIIFRSRKHEDCDVFIEQNFEIVTKN